MFHGAISPDVEVGNNFIINSQSLMSMMLELVAKFIYRQEQKLMVAVK